MSIVLRSAARAQSPDQVGDDGRFEVAAIRWAGLRRAGKACWRQRIGSYAPASSAN